MSFITLHQRREGAGDLHVKAEKIECYYEQFHPGDDTPIGCFVATHSGNLFCVKEHEAEIHDLIRQWAHV